MLESLKENLVIIMTTIAVLIIFTSAYYYKNKDKLTAKNSEKENTDTIPKKVTDWKGINKIIVTIFIWITIILILYFLGFSIKGCFSSKPEDKPDSSGNSHHIIYFPISGEGFATMENPIRAYLDPLKSYTKVDEGYAKFIFVDDPEIFFISNKIAEKDIEYVRKWWKFPKGNYLIYPYGKIKIIIFSWWQ